MLSPAFSVPDPQHAAAVPIDREDGVAVEAMRVGVLVLKPVRRLSEIMGRGSQMCFLTPTFSTSPAPPSPSGCFFSTRSSSPLSRFSSPP